LIRASAALASLLVLAGPATPPGQAILIRSTPVPLNPSDPAQDRVGPLSFRGGIELRSSDKRFGGLSDLVVSPDRKTLAAVSDEGAFLTARLVYDHRGFLSGLEDGTLHVLHDTLGKELEGKERQDAESLAQMADGSFVVGFERWHRIWRYPDGPGGRAEALPPPSGLEESPDNGGLETLVPLGGDRLLALTEQKIKDGAVEGWLRSGGRWEPLGLRIEGVVQPSGGCRLPSGDLLVLERHWSKEAGHTVKLVRVPRASIKAGSVMEGQVAATLLPPLTLDNFEGVSCRAGARGETLLYLLSDDNFGDDQRTLLLMFALSR
jgi:hypothetical protein